MALPLQVSIYSYDCYFKFFGTYTGGFLGNGSGTDDHPCGIIGLFKELASFSITGGGVAGIDGKD
jgi:hypothetical protein